MNNIQKLIEAWEVTKEPEIKSNFYQRHIDFSNAAKEAMPEIVELAEWIRHMSRHDYGCSGEFGYPCKCGLDRVRELVWK